MEHFTGSSSSSSSTLCEDQIALAAAMSSAAVDDDSYEDACSICLEPFSTEDPATVTSCRHEYHLQCILDWSQRSKECPICWQRFVLKDPARQELLVAIQSERLSKAKTVSPPAPPTFYHLHEDYDFERDTSYLDDSDFEERVMQHLAAAASRARYFRRRERQRSFGLDPSQLIFGSPANASGMQPTNTTSPDSSHGSSESVSPASYMRTAVHAHPPTSVPDITINRDQPFDAMALFCQPLPQPLPRRSNSSENVSFSDSIKSRWSAASARYKESFSKSTRGLKEKLLARNTSVKELSKEVHREMSAGIAGVAKMIERLDLASKRANGSPIPGSPCTVGTPSAVFKGNSVEENVIHKRSGEVAPDSSSDSPSYVSGNPVRSEVLHAQRGL